MAARRSQVLDLIFVCVIVTYLGKVRCNEPHCSKFDFEEKVLEKLVRMEYKAEMQEKSVRKELGDMKSELESYRDDWQRLKQENDDLKTSLKSVAQNSLDQIASYKESLVTPTVMFKARRMKVLSLDKGQTMIFKDVMFNNGSGYDNTRGVFTCPIEGVYLFTIHLCSPTNKYITYDVMVDGTIHTKGANRDATSQVCTSADAIVELQEESRVWVQSNYDEDELYEDGYRWSSFSGVLIHS
ncbi:complement C1q tumor necrosis factor-related protein 5-like [Mya arenaria]|uniref:complement C1q tumor necrosis factor-related protein 5-like n=1 Tax=Mya arenaria TaxID=6604 RepID=UPI0022E2EB1B|nr:complement C1q tumor necrosis factor-related protein 5-like [Mya arenaria]